MSDLKNKTQNVGPGLEIDPGANEVVCDLSPEALKNIFFFFLYKAVLLTKVHESLFVGGIKTIFDLENPNLTNEEKQILKGIQVDLKKRVKHIDDIVQAFDLKNPKLLDQVKNINSINFINCQKYKIEEKLKKINISKWSPEELKIHQKVSLTLRIQTKLVDEMKEIMIKSTEKVK